jgi:broad specificity phosphatase PhoE
MPTQERLEAVGQRGEACIILRTEVTLPNGSQQNAWTLATGDETPPGAESVDEFESRVRNALEQIEPSPDGAPVAVVTHGGPVRVVLRMLHDGRLEVDGDDRPPPPPLIENCSILQLQRTREGRWRIACVNDATHLKGLRTPTDEG